MERDAAGRLGDGVPADLDPPDRAWPRRAPDARAALRSRDACVPYGLLSGPPSRPVPDVPLRVQAAWPHVRAYAGVLFKRLATQPIFLWAQAIAFKVLVTLLPLILLATGIFGLVVRSADPFETVAGFLRTFLPEDQAGALIELVFELQKTSGALTFVGAAAFLVTVVTLFSTLRYVVGAAMGEGRHHMRGILPGYLFDLRMMVQVGGLFAASFALTFVVGLLNARSARMARAVGLDGEVAQQIGGAAAGLVTVVLPFLLTVGMLWQLYYFVPRPRPRKRGALLGATVTAVLFEAAKNGFRFYAQHVGKFDRWAGQTEGLDGLGAFFGLILAFLFWVYLSGLVLIVGAVVTGLDERRNAPRRTAALRRLWGTMGNRRRARAGRRLRPASAGAAPPLGDGAAETPAPAAAPPEAARALPAT